MAERERKLHVSDTGKMIAVGVGVGLVALLGVYLVGRKAAAVIKENAYLVDPTDPNNAAYVGVNKVGTAITGDQNFSLGVKVFDAVDTVKGWFGFGEPDLTAPVNITDKAL